MGKPAVLDSRITRRQEAQRSDERKLGQAKRLPSENQIAAFLVRRSGIRVAQLAMRLYVLHLSSGPPHHVSAMAPMGLSELM